MRRLILVAVCLLCSGCSYHPVPVKVYGGSGAAYSAPDLCAALTQCLKSSSESVCYYNSSHWSGSSGSYQDECQAVKK